MIKENQYKLEDYENIIALLETSINELGDKTPKELYTMWGYLGKLIIDCRRNIERHQESEEE